MDHLGFLVGRTVARVSYEDGLTLHLDGDGGSVSIGTFTLKDAVGHVHEVLAGAKRFDPSAYRELVHHAITEAMADDGTLRVRFDDGSEITAFPEDRVESWEVSAGKNFVVCMPGGKVAIFG